MRRRSWLAGVAAACGLSLALPCAGLSKPTRPTVTWDWTQHVITVSVDDRDVVITKEALHFRPELVARELERAYGGKAHLLGYCDVVMIGGRADGVGVCFGKVMGPTDKVGVIGGRAKMIDGRYVEYRESIHYRWRDGRRLTLDSYYNRPMLDRLNGGPRVAVG